MDHIDQALAEDRAARAPHMVLSAAENYGVNHPVRIGARETQILSLHMHQFGRGIRKEDRALVQGLIVHASIELSEFKSDGWYSKGRAKLIKNKLAADLTAAGCQDVTKTISNVVQAVRNV